MHSPGEALCSEWASVFGSHMSHYDVLPRNIAAKSLSSSAETTRNRLVPNRVTSEIIDAEGRLAVACKPRLPVQIEGPWSTRLNCKLFPHGCVDNVSHEVRSGQKYWVTSKLTTSKVLFPALLRIFWPSSCSSKCLASSSFLIRDHRNLRPQRYAHLNMPSWSSRFSTPQNHSRCCDRSSINLSGHSRDARAGRLPWWIVQKLSPTHQVTRHHQNHKLLQVTQVVFAIKQKNPHWISLKA